MHSNTLSKTLYSYCSHLFTLLFTIFFSLAFVSGQAQNCTTPPGTLVNGNFDMPATIGSGNSGINNDLLGWFVSHGHPTTASVSPRSMWMWSYTNTSGQLKGEGVFNCYDFQQGQSYLICFDLQTNVKADGATVDVRASNGLSAHSGTSTLYPTGITNELIWQDLTANYSYTNWTKINVVYTPTSDYSQIWFHPLWTGVTPGTPAPHGNPGQAEMRIDNVSITPLIDPTDPCPCDLTSGFTYSTTDTLCAIQFNETSSGNCCTNVLGWQWDFGDGTTGTGANPQHTFPGSGTYEVCLTTVGLNSEGECCTDKVCYEVTVNCDPCVCNIDADFKMQVEECQVRFNDISTQSSCTQITGWSWDFGDGNSSTAQNPIHQYSTSGTYPVCLTVYGTDGTQNCNDVICYDVEVNCEGDCPCTIDGDFDFDIKECTVNFHGFGDSDCEIIGWSWDFGDGNTSSLQNPSHIYNNGGVYNVCLTISVRTPEGIICDETFCRPIEVEDCEDCRCTIDGYFAYNIDGCKANFAGFSESDCDIVGWSWDFGDGNTSNLQNPSHIYNSPGIYNVCFTIMVMSPEGTLCSETFCQPVEVAECEGEIKKKSGAANGGTSSLPLEPKVYPNPTDGILFIEFNSEKAMDITIEVFSSSMKHITTLVDAHYEIGFHKVEWQTQKNNIAPGTYFILLKSGEKVKFEKVVLTD